MAAPVIQTQRESSPHPVCSASSVPLHALSPVLIYIPLKLQTLLLVLLVQSLWTRPAMSLAFPLFFSVAIEISPGRKRRPHAHAKEGLLGKQIQRQHGEDSRGGLSVQRNHDRQKFRRK